MMRRGGDEEELSLFHFSPPLPIQSKHHWPWRVSSLLTCAPSTPFPTSLPFKPAPQLPTLPALQPAASSASTTAPAPSEQATRPPSPPPHALRLPSRISTQNTRTASLTSRSCSREERSTSTPRAGATRGSRSRETSFATLMSWFVSFFSLFLLPREPHFSSPHADREPHLSQENMLDYVAIKLGSDAETLETPVAMTESFCNPSYSRSRMTSLSPSRNLRWLMAPSTQSCRNSSSNPSRLPPSLTVSTPFSPSTPSPPHPLPPTLSSFLPAHLPRA